LAPFEIRAFERKRQRAETTQVARTAVEERQMRVRVDPNLCTAAQNCVAIAPDHFEMDNQGLAHAVKNPVAKEDADVLSEAAESCAIGAVILEDDEGEQIYP
jgi:ferredoxin